MATDKAGPPEGFTKAEVPTSENDDYDTEWADRPDLGSMLQGMLLAQKPDRGDYDTTVLEMRLTQPYGEHDADDLVSLWSTNGIDAALEEAGVERGDEVALTCDETWEEDGDQKRGYAVYTEANE